MADKKETLKLLPTTHVASAMGLATWGSPLSVYMACRRQADFGQNPEAPEKEARTGVRAWASRLLGRKFFKPRTTWCASGRLACLAGVPDGVTAEGEMALLLRMPKPKKVADGGDDPLKLWETALETRVLPLAERIECAALAQLAPWEIQVGCIFEGRLHIMAYKPDAELESKVGAAMFGFYKGVGAGKVPAALETDRLTLKALYPKHTAKHLVWKSLSAEDREHLEKWYLAKEARLEAERVEGRLEPRTLEIIGEASGVELAGLGHFIERIDYMAKEAAPHAGTYKEIAHIHLSKCISPKSAKALLDKNTPAVGARSLKVYGGKGRRPGQLGGRVETETQLDASVLKLHQLRDANPAAGSPEFKLLADLEHEVKAYKPKETQVER